MLAAARCAGESKGAPSQVPYKFQKFFSYFNSTSVIFWRVMLTFKAALTVGAQPGSQAVLGADWTRVSEAGAHRPPKSLAGPSANDNLLVQCWWECGLARLTTFQTFPRERSSCDRAATQTSVPLTHFLHSRQQLHIVGGKGRGRQSEENREA